MKYVIIKQYVQITGQTLGLWTLNLCSQGHIKIFLNLFGEEKSPGLQGPSWHCSYEVLLEAHSFPPEQVLVLDLLQLVPQADHSLHPKDVAR